MTHLDCSHAEQGGRRHNASNGKKNPWRRVRLHQRYDDVPAKQQRNRTREIGKMGNYTTPLCAYSLVFPILATVNAVNDTSKRGRTCSADS